MTDIQRNDFNQTEIGSTIYFLNHEVSFFSISYCKFLVLQADTGNFKPKTFCYSQKLKIILIKFFLLEEKNISATLGGTIS